MKIKKVLGATVEEIKNKKFNIWIGISLGNKYFTKPRIKAYILWALQYSKSDVVVVIADSLHIVNFQVLKNYTRKRAKERTKKLGNDIRNSIKKIINTLPIQEKKRVRIINWDEATNNIAYREAEKVAFNLFKNDQNFKGCILQVVKKQLGRHAPKDQKKIERLAEYVLKELPALIGGIKYNNKIYTLIPYPGLTELDKVVNRIQTEGLFPHLRENLKFGQERVIVEAYVE